MNGELLSILESIERDKGIDREILIQAVEAALATAARKSVGARDDQEVIVNIDRKNGSLSVTSDSVKVDSIDFSRIAAQTAKQVIIQKIREAERDVIFTEYEGRVGDIVTGAVHRFERGDIIVELGRAEAILPKSERIPHEEYRQGDRIQAYVLEVRRSTKGPAIVLSRTHEGFIQGLVTLEVPEVVEGIVEITGIAREAGDRTKIAVSSRDDKVDCVGACVGMRGTRVKNIVRELHGEKVDVIRWHDNIDEFIVASLSPAKISEIHKNPDAKKAIVVVEDDQLSLAIGKRGQNVRLASKLTKWELEIKSRTQMLQGQAPLRELPRVGEMLERRINEAGITNILQLATLTLDQLSAIQGVGEKTSQRLMESAQQFLESAAVKSEAEKVSSEQQQESSEESESSSDISEDSSEVPPAEGDAEAESDAPEDASSQDDSEEVKTSAEGEQVPPDQDTSSPDESEEVKPQTETEASPEATDAATIEGNVTDETSSSDAEEPVPPDQDTSSNQEPEKSS